VYEDQPVPNRVAAGISGGVCVNHLWPVVAGGGGMKDEALKLALEALEREEYRLRQTGQSQVYSGIGFAITTIKQALAAPVQEPVGEKEISAWAERHDIQGTPTDLRSMFEDAASFTTPPAAQPASEADMQVYRSIADNYRKDLAAAQPAVPDAIHHTDLSEHPQYIEGWNDCRAEMLRGNT